MNADKSKNLEEAFLAVGQLIAAAWSYFHVLRALDNGRRENPELVQAFGFFYERTWRATFDGFFAKVGTVLDSTKGTYSLPNLVTIIKRYGNADTIKCVSEIQDFLKDRESSVGKLQKWRHDTVAQRPTLREDEIFYSSNKMNLTEIEAVLTQIDEIFNRLSMRAVRVHNDTRTGTESIVAEGTKFFALAAASLPAKRSI